MCAVRRLAAVTGSRVAFGGAFCTVDRLAGIVELGLADPFCNFNGTRPSPFEHEIVLRINR